MGANEAFAENVSQQLMEEAGYGQKIMASIYETVKDNIKINKKVIPGIQQLPSNKLMLGLASGQTPKTAEKFLSHRPGLASYAGISNTIGNIALGASAVDHPIYQELEQAYVAHRGGSFISALDSSAAEVASEVASESTQAAKGVFGGLRELGSTMFGSSGRKTSSRIIEGMQEAKKVAGGSRNLGIGLGIGVGAVALAGLGHMRNAKKDNR